MRILLARHAQSEWQVSPSDDRDSALTRVGHEQARRLAAWLAGDAAGAVAPTPAAATYGELAALYTSPLARARQTAAYAARSLAHAAIVEDSLREAEFHVASELPALADPLAAAAPFAASDRYLAFRTQAQHALRVLVRAAQAHGGAVLAVTHGGLMKTLLRIVAGSEHVSFRLYNACPSLIEWRRGRWHLVHLNLWDHLPVELRTE
jgi:probable phosphoglycerate mutase